MFFPPYLYFLLYLPLDGEFKVVFYTLTKYVNIWVCNMGNTLLGYGEFPTASLSTTWGLVLHYKYTGSGGSAIAPYNLGRTGTHEFGHCFNLFQSHFSYVAVATFYIGIY